MLTALCPWCVRPSNTFNQLKHLTEIYTENIRKRIDAEIMSGITKIMKTKTTDKTRLGRPPPLTSQDKDEKEPLAALPTKLLGQLGLRY